MLTLKGIALRIFLIFALLWLSGCESDNPVGDRNKITGTVYDEGGFPISGLNVNIGNHQPFYLTQADGKFTFDNSEYPYDIIVGNLILYKNLNSKNLKLTANFHVNRNLKILHIDVPKIFKKNEVQLVKFLSNEINYNFISTDPFFEKSLFVYYPLFNSMINGKIVFLSYLTDTFGEVISYEHYGAKDITITDFSPDTIKFSESELSFDPPECDVILNLEYPGTDYYYTSVYLNFKNYNYFPWFYLMGFADKNTSKHLFKQPVLDESIDIRTTSYRRLSEAGSLPGEYTIQNYFDLCEGNSIVIPEVSFLRYPENYQIDVGRNTDFIFEKDKQDCVYKLSISLDSSYNYRYPITVYTSENRVNFGELIDYGFFVPSLTLHFWNVTKYTGYNSIDEFTNNPPFENNLVAEIITSPRREFMTGSLK